VVQIFFSYVLILICGILLVAGLGLIIHGVLGFMKQRPIDKQGKESVEEIPHFRRSA